MKKRLRILIPVLLVAAGALLWWGLGRGDAGEPPLEAAGTVEATEADLGFRVPGRLESVPIREGDAVAAGQELAALDRAEIQARVSGARAQLAAAEAALRELRSGTRPAEVRSAEAALQVAREREEDAAREAGRARRLFEGGAVSQQAVERAVTALEVARNERVRAEQALDLAREGPRVETLEAQSARVEQARAQLAQVEVGLDDAVIRAPFPGVVTLRHREPGETVGAGQPVLTLLDRDDRWVRIYLAGDRIGRVSLGQRATIRSDTWPDRRYDGEVIFIGSEAEFTPRNVQTSEERTRLVYPVKVRITGDPGFELKPGIPADVTLLEADAAEGMETAGGAEG